MRINKRLKGLMLELIPFKILQGFKKIHYLRTLKFASESYESDLTVIKHLVNAGDYVIDIGANIGVYTKILSEIVGRDGRVFSIEPISFTFDILKSNVSKLNLRNVELINSAISDIDAIFTMEIPKYEFGGENFYQAKIVNKKIDSRLRLEKVEAKRLDKMFSDISHRISFIKCDVEGHELPCLKGAINIIKKSRPAWLIEISGEPNDTESSAFDTFKLLEKNGNYKAFWFDGKKLYERGVGDKSVNYFFLSSDHIRILKEKSLLDFNSEKSIASSVLNKA